MLFAAALQAEHAGGAHKGAIMDYAEKYAAPAEGSLGTYFPLRNDMREVFYLRWGMICFDVFWGAAVNIKVILKVYRSDATCESFLVETDPHDIRWNRHTRTTRDFFIHPFPSKQGKIVCVKFSFIVHLRGISIPSEKEYIFMDWADLDDNRPRQRTITGAWSTTNTYRTCELDSGVLQRDVDWYNHHFSSLQLVPKFTRGVPGHPYHPKHYIHACIDKTIREKQGAPDRLHTIKVCMDSFDDTDFVNHLLYASRNGVWVQCIVDWRKMTLTNSENYLRLKRSGIELLGVFCTPPADPAMEVPPDMHTKFIIFGNQDCILGSFNITFDMWWANWESGMTFHSQGVCRLLDNIFQSIRGGVIQRYGIDPLSPFNLLYTFGCQSILSGKYYRPHQAIISEIHRARQTIRLCLFLINELRGDYNDSVIDALISARRRGVDVHAILNGHMARVGDPGREYPMHAELRRQLVPAIDRLKQAGITVTLTYGHHDCSIPYCPIHSKYCIIDDYIVLEGSFNWYNTSVFSHDLLVVAASPEVAAPYSYEFHQILNSFKTFS
jgi:hypothetical protein